MDTSHSSPCTDDPTSTGSVSAIYPLSSAAFHLPLLNTSTTSSVSDTEDSALSLISTASDSSLGEIYPPSPTALHGPTASGAANLPPEWETFTNLHGGIYYSYDNGRLLTRDDITIRWIHDNVMDAYFEFKRYFVLIKRTPPYIDDGEMLIFHAEEVPFVKFASWSRGKVYDCLDDKYGESIHIHLRLTGSLILALYRD